MAKLIGIKPSKAQSNIRDIDLFDSHESLSLYVSYSGYDGRNYRGIPSTAPLEFMNGCHHDVHREYHFIYRLRTGFSYNIVGMIVDEGGRKQMIFQFVLVCGNIRSLIRSAIVVWLPRVD